MCVYLDGVQNFDHARVSHRPQFLERILGEGQSALVCDNIEGEDAAIAAIFL